jgi:hypothetical protein
MSPLFAAADAVEPPEFSFLVSEAVPFYVKIKRIGSLISALLFVLKFELEPI